MNKQYKKIEVERDGPIGVIRLNDPDKVNATSYAMLDEMDDALTTLSSSVGAIVLTGTGRNFCAGAGLDNLKQDMGDIGIGLETHVNPMLNKLRSLPIPWISAVRGAAAGLGCSFALAADLIIASETAYFVQAFVRVGLVPDGGSSYLLTRGLSRARAMEMMLLGDKVRAPLALEWGLINRVVPDGELESAAHAIAMQLASGPTFALRLIRQNAWRALDSGWDAALQAERVAQRAAGGTTDFSEGLSAFLEKRPPRFQGS